MPLPGGLFTPVCSRTAPRHSGISRGTMRGTEPAARPCTSACAAHVPYPGHPPRRPLALLSHSGSGGFSDRTSRERHGLQAGGGRPAHRTSQLMRRFKCCPNSPAPSLASRARNTNLLSRRPPEKKARLGAPGSHSFCGARAAGAPRPVYGHGHRQLVQEPPAPGTAPGETWLRCARRSLLARGCLPAQLWGRLPVDWTPPGKPGCA